MDILTAAVLKFLLKTLLKEVDAKLEAEVLLLQVIEVLWNSTVAVKHDRFRHVGVLRPLIPVPYCLNHTLSLHAIKNILNKPTKM